MLQKAMKLNQAQLDNFNRNFDEVEQVVKACQNPAEVLKKYNVSDDIFDKAKTYVDKPLVKPILRLFNMGGDSAINIIDNLKNSGQAPKQAQGVKSETLQERLARLK